jgi:hypothetical protein
VRESEREKERNEGIKRENRKTEEINWDRERNMNEQTNKQREKKLK